MLAVPMVAELKLTLHCAVPLGGTVVGDSVHGLPVNDAPRAIPVWVNVTGPVGVVGKAEGSTTVALQFVVVLVGARPVGSKGIVDGVHVTVVVVECNTTAVTGKLTVLVLVRWFVSPL